MLASKRVLLLAICFCFIANVSFVVGDESDDFAPRSETPSGLYPKRPHTIQSTMKSKPRNNSKLDRVMESSNGKFKLKTSKQSKTSDGSWASETNKGKHSVSLRSGQFGNTTTAAYYYPLANDQSLWPNATRFRLYRRSNAMIDTVVPIGEAHAMFDCERQTLLIRAVRNDAFLRSPVCTVTNECEANVEILGASWSSIYHAMNVSFFATYTSGWAVAVQQHRPVPVDDDDGVSLLHAHIFVSGSADDGGNESDFVNVSILRNCSSTANLTNVNTIETYPGDVVSTNFTNKTFPGGDGGDAPNSMSGSDVVSANLTNGTFPGGAGGKARNTSESDVPRIEFGPCLFVALLPFTAV